MSIKRRDFDDYFRQFTKRVEHEIWVLSVVFHDKTGLNNVGCGSSGCEPASASPRFQEIIDAINLVLCSYPFITTWGMKAFPLNRSEGGINLIPFSRSITEVYFGRIDFTYANVRIVEYLPIGENSVLLRFKAKSGCPKAFMFLLEYVLRFLVANAEVVATEGYPPHDEIVYCGDVCPLNGPPIFPQRPQRVSEAPPELLEQFEALKSN